MHFTIKKSVLLKNLNYVSKAIVNNSPVPSLSGVLFELNNEGLVLIGSNLETNIKAFIPKTINSEEVMQINTLGSMVLNASFVNEIVRKIEDEHISFELLDQKMCKITSTKSVFSLNCIDHSDYPKFIVDKSEDVLTFENSKIKEFIHQTVFAISKNEARPVLTGLNFNFVSDLLNISATDSYRLAYKSVKLDDSYDYNLIIPGKSLIDLTSIIDDSGSLKMYLFNAKVIFEFDNIIYQTKLLEGTYPNTQKLLPEEFNLEIKTDAKDFVKAVERASILSRDRMKNVVQLVVEGNHAKLLSNTPEFGKVDEDLTIENLTGGNIDISFSARYIKEAILALDCKTVIIKFNSDMKPFICVNEEDNSIIQLVLPVRTY